MESPTSPWHSQLHGDLGGFHPSHLHSTSKALQINNLIKNFWLYCQQSLASAQSAKSFPG